LFFAKESRQFFNQAYITCLLFKGTDKVHVLDHKDFAGGIVADIEDALRFIERNTRTAYRIEGLRREDIPEYPMKALREAITNAVMHRDWFIEGANVFVEIYSDRIEFPSPGALPKGMTLADLGRKSIRRNALIADLLHRISFIEKAGTGIRPIRDDARAQGCPEPKFEVTGFVTATFFPNPAVRAHAEAQQAGQFTGEVTEQVTEQVSRLLQALREDTLSSQEILERLVLSHRPTLLYDYLQPALRAALIEMTVPDKPRSSRQRYRLTAQGREVLKKQKKES
jgi:ATP-dependent DNA helicase RecG